MGRVSLGCLGLIATTQVALAGGPRAVIPPPGVSAVRTLSQNWSDEESNWFYNVPQGSRLLPYDWFRLLEQPDSQERFLDPAHVHQLGYIPREPSADNPDGLPIGFIRDAAYPDETPAVGMTCAACHTGLIQLGDKAWLIDGGPTLADLETFQRRLAKTLQQTADDDAKFGRFSVAAVGLMANAAQRQELRARLRTIAQERAAYNARNLPAAGAPAFGPGRVDAFGAILNEVTVTYLGLPENVRPANAPVSYPCVWDAPQHDRVQWNGAAKNEVQALAQLLFGTQEICALGRNAGEVLGVFGHTDVPLQDALDQKHYPSTIHKPNLIAIEDSLKSLWSPEWPAAFPAIDPDRRRRGKDLYTLHCATCHADMQRDDPQRRTTAVLEPVGTDPTMALNFVTREAATGRLEGRFQELFSLKKFGPRAPAAVILRHVVQRVILNDLLPNAPGAALLAIVPVGVNSSLSPGYETSVTIESAGRTLQVELQSLTVAPDGAVTGLEASASTPSERTHLLNLEGLAAQAVALSDLESVQKVLPAAKSLALKIARAPGLEAADAAPADAGAIQLSYKARPLNGVWATAPYLHNGSVATLADLLTSAADRKPFHVGSRVFDPVRVGFVSDPAYPLFDPVPPGNHNSGHDFGTELDAAQKLDLIEYLKSL